MTETSHPPLRKKALVVDDNEDAARGLELMLQSFGYETDIAFDGIEGLRKATSFQPDLLLLDISMPKLDGYDTCGVIRAQPWGAKTRLVAITGWDPRELQDRAEAAGFDAWLLKPVDFAELEKICRPS
jgi:CheY-like chemotaxis protein